MKSHAFSEYRAVTIALRRPLSQILGTEAARDAEVSSAHRKAWETRRAPEREMTETLRGFVQSGDGGSSG